MGTNEDVMKKLTVNEGSAAGVVVDAGSVLHETLAGLMMESGADGVGGERTEETCKRIGFPLDSAMLNASERRNACRGRKECALVMGSAPIKRSKSPADTT